MSFEGVLTLLSCVGVMLSMSDLCGQEKSFYLLCEAPRKT